MKLFKVIDNKTNFKKFIIVNKSAVTVTNMLLDAVILSIIELIMFCFIDFFFEQRFIDS